MSLGALGGDAASSCFLVMNPFESKEVIKELLIKIRKFPDLS
jgi:hypothetical protein